MKKIDTFDISPDNHAFRVFDGAISNKIITYHYVTEQLVKQGFSGQSGNFNLYTFGECMGFIIEVWVAEISDQISVIPETLRAILLPLFSWQTRYNSREFYSGSGSTCSYS